MITRRLLAAALTGALAVAVAVAAPAAAYPRDDYSYAASHMIDRPDIPASLGTFKKAATFNASLARTVYACEVPLSDPDAPDVSVRYPGGKYAYTVTYYGRGREAPFVFVQVNQYSSDSAAIKAFDLLQKRISLCTGTGSNTWQDDDGTSTTYSTQLTHGVVPEVSTLGVDALFVSNNSLSASTPGDSRYLNDSYVVFSLFGDVIIQTQYYSNSNVNLTTKQRKSVNQMAFNAESAWLAE